MKQQWSIAFDHEQFTWLAQHFLNGFKTRINHNIHYFNCLHFSFFKLTFQTGLLWKQKQINKWFYWATLKFSTTEKQVFPKWNKTFFFIWTKTFGHKNIFSSWYFVYTFIHLCFTLELPYPLMEKLLNIKSMEWLVVTNIISDRNISRKKYVTI